MKNLQEENGYIFIIVVWVLVILGVILVSMLDKVNLDNMLIENDLSEKKIYNTGLSAAMLAVNRLKDDTTVYDCTDDDWAEPYEEILNDDIKCLIRISDTGSKININYCDNDIFKELEWWEEDYSKQLEEITNEEFIIPDLYFVKDIFSEEEYQDIQRLFTTYGEYNINNDSVNGLEKLMKEIDLDDASIKTLTEGINKFRKENNHLEGLEQMQLLIEGVDPVLFEKIRPYLGTTPRININLVEQEVLELIMLKEDISTDTAEKLMKYRKDNIFKEIDDLKSYVGKSTWNKLKKYCTVSSDYFQVNITMFSAENKEDKDNEEDNSADNDKVKKDEDKEILKQIKIVVERKLQEDQWQIKFIKWSEPEVMKVDNPEVMESDNNEK